MIIKPQPLTAISLQVAVSELAGRDENLAQIVERYGVPPLWQSPQTFASLLYIILEQQVSLASARATYNRLSERLDEITPHRFLSLTDQNLKDIGFSRQKSHYIRLLAQALINGDLDLEALVTLDDTSAAEMLTALKGIGPWTAGVYLLTALLRPDIWPVGDLALVLSIQRLKGMNSPPTRRQFETIGNAYRPWRSVAARLYWWSYLEGKEPV